MAIVHPSRYAMIPKEDGTLQCPNLWSYRNAFFFTGTIGTTIGYGNVYPTTDGGKVELGLVVKQILIRKLDILCLLCTHVNSTVWLLHGKNWRFAQALHGQGVDVLVWTQLNTETGVPGASHLHRTRVPDLLNSAGGWFPLFRRVAVFGRVVFHHYYINNCWFWRLYTQFPRGRRALIQTDAFLFGDLPNNRAHLDVGRFGVAWWIDFDDF